MAASGVGAFLAATYLVWDARRIDDATMVEYFRRRAVGAAEVAGVVALGEPPVRAGEEAARSLWLAL